MSYFRERGEFSGLGADPVFTGQHYNLPICPATDKDGFCRKFVGGSPEYHPQQQSTVSSIGAGIGAFLSTLGKPPVVAAVPGVVPIMPAPTGMSTTTKLALAGGAALLLVLVATR